MKIKNRLSLLSAFLRRDLDTRGFPVEVGIEVINFCNLRCIMCPYAEMVTLQTRPQQKMDFALYRKIIAEIAPLTELIYLHGLGEPLLHPQIFQFIEYAKKKQLRVGISTNATLLDAAKARKLLASSVDYVILAMDGATKKTYEKIRVNANFAVVERNIKRFLQLSQRVKNKPFTVVQLITLPENEAEIDAFRKRWQGKGASVIRVKPKIALKDTDKEKVKNPPRYCFHLFRQLNIYADGTVVACCEDVHGRFPLGNVKEDSLAELWNSPKMRLLRRKNFAGRRRDVNLCRSCTYPQPSLLEAIGVLALDQLTVKKILPFLERWL